MALIKPLNGKEPKFGKNVYLSENATIIGEVVCGENCSFWFQSVVRGDVNSIEFGDNVNVQDGAIVHCTYLKAATKVGNNVSIGHKAIVHGCTIDDNVLIGMGAIVMDHAHVPSNVIIAAGAVVTENRELEPNSIYAGIPAKKIKSIEPEHTKGIIERIAQNYIKYAGWYSE